MKNIATLIAAAGLASFASAQDLVAPITLVDGDSLSGIAVMDDDLTNAVDGNWFIFDANAGDEIVITVSREQAAPDLALDFYAGDITGADVTGLLVDDFTFGGGDGFAGLSFIGTFDDENDDAFGGPFGDPEIAGTLLVGGTFSFVVWAYTDPGSFSIDVSIVPAPASAGLLALGGLVATRRRR